MGRNKVVIGLLACVLVLCLSSGLLADVCENVACYSPNDNDAHGGTSWDNGGNAERCDGTYATCDTNGLWHEWDDFQIPNPGGGARITGFKIGLQGYGSGQSIEVFLSYNGGTTYGSTLSGSNMITVDGVNQMHWLGGPLETWTYGLGSHQWTWDEVDGNNELTVVLHSVMGGGTIYLDCVYLCIYWTYDTQGPTIDWNADCPQTKVFCVAPGETATSCSGGGIPSNGVPTVTDNCGLATPYYLAETGLHTGCPWPVGDTVVTWTAEDKFGNTTVAYQTVRVIQDSQPPTITCPGNQTLPVDGSCQATLPDYRSMATVSDNSDQCANCSGPTVTQTPAPGGTYSGAGTVVPVTLTATDAFSNSASCMFNVTLVDDTPPTVTCQDITVPLDATGHASIVPSDVYDSGSDNCGTVNLVSVTPNAFTCANLGANTVTLTVNDGNGNTNTCQATVTVVDITSPSVTCQNKTVYLDDTGHASITPSDVYASGSDNCGTVNLQVVSPNAFDCSDLGTNTVILTVNDGHGNPNFCQATVTVEDNIDPTARCKDITVALDASGQTSITGSDVDDGSTDNCAIASRSVSPNAFTCANLGGNSVTLTVFDTSNNSATCTATVTVVDTTPPSVTCQNKTVYLDASGSASITPNDVYASGSDNCGTVNLVSVIPNAFTCTNLGANPVTLTVNDGHGNTNTCQATVTVVDNTPPSVTCQNKTVYLDGTGHASITPSDVYVSGSDNCGTVNLVSVTPNTFTCANLGENTVTLTVNDGHGNTNTCQATVTIIDNTAPIAQCKDITVALDASGQTSITAADVDDGSTDNCGIVARAVNPHAFTCANLGANTVTLTVGDASGNIDTCPSTVSVVDSLPPIPDPDAASTREDIAIVIDVLDGDTDNCDGLILKSVSSPPHGSAIVVGAQVLYTPGLNWSGTDTFTYTVADASGNEAIGTVTVTVGAENDPPVAKFSLYATCVPHPVSVSLEAHDSDIDAGDPDLHPLTFSVIGGPTHGTLTGELSEVTYTAPDAAQVELVYTPAGDFSGTETVYFRVEDPLGAGDTGVVNVVVSPCDAATAELPGFTIGRLLTIVVPLSFKESEEGTAGIVLEYLDGVEAETIPWEGILRPREIEAVENVQFILNTGPLLPGTYRLCFPLPGESNCCLIIKIEA